MGDIYLKKNMLQICIIAKDCRRINENWAKLLGKNFAGLSRYENEGITAETEYHHKMYDNLGLETNTYDLAYNGKSIQFEVMAALNGPSEWYDFQCLRNQGIHHIAFEFTVDDFPKGLDDLYKNCKMDRVQLGSPYATPDAKYAYLDTKRDGGTTIEILGFGKYGDSVKQYRQVSALIASIGENTAPLSKMLPSNVCLITKDIEKSLKTYAPLFNEKEPEVCEEKHTATYNGKENEVTMKTAYMDFNTANVFFAEPLSKNNFWADFKDKYDSGICSICYEVEDIDAKTKQLEEYNFKAVQKGIYEDGTEYVILDGYEDYATCIELRTSPSIKEKVEQNKKEDIPYHKDCRYNELTPLNELFASEHCCKVLDKYFPGFIENTKQSMAISYRMPLAMIMLMGNKKFDNAKTEKLISELNGK